MDIIFDLNDALTIGLPTIMKDLYNNQKCDRSNYNIKLMTDQDRDTTAEVYSEMYDIILCLYYNDKCISSVIGRYDYDKKSMEILSKTNKEFENRKYNLYLRTAFIYLMCFIKPDIDTIYSFSENPISTYTMYKYYHASNDELNVYIQDNDLTPDTFTFNDAKQFHEYLKELSLEALEEQLGNDSPKSLGYESLEQAIRLTSKAISIPLSLSLKTPDIKTFLLSKLQSIIIKCDKKGGTKKKKKAKLQKKSRKCVKKKRFSIKRYINIRYLK